MIWSYSEKQPCSILHRHKYRSETLMECLQWQTDYSTRCTVRIYRHLTRTIFNSHFSAIAIYRWSSTGNGSGVTLKLFSRLMETDPITMPSRSLQKCITSHWISLSKMFAFVRKICWPAIERFCKSFCISWSQIYTLTCAI